MLGFGPLMTFFSLIFETPSPIVTILLLGTPVLPPSEAVMSVMNDPLGSLPKNDYGC